MRKGFFVKLVTVLLTSMVLLGCDLLTGGTDDPAQSGNSVSGLRLSRSSLSVKAGSMEHIDLQITPESARQGLQLTWEWDPEVISVKGDNYGAVVTGVNAGECALVVRAGGISATCIIRVSGTAPGGGGDPYIYSSPRKTFGFSRCIFPEGKNVCSRTKHRQHEGCNLCVNLIKVWSFAINFKIQ